MAYYVYTLKSLKDKRRYIGFTRNLKKRLMRHNRGRVFSTKHRRPFELISFKRFETIKEAIKHEKLLKHR